MRVVVALGGNALQKRGEPMTVENQRANVRIAAEALAPVALEHELVSSHGNGPQVGLLALQAAAYTGVEAYPLDVLGAQTEGMIGYMIEQELGNLLPVREAARHMLTMIEVDPDDPAFADPTKFVGPVYDEARPSGWPTEGLGGQAGRRQVAPGGALAACRKRIFEIRPVQWLLEKGAVVICAGGGGIPTMYLPGRTSARWSGSRRSSTRTSPAPCWPGARRRPARHRHRRRRRLPRTGARPSSGPSPPRQPRCAGRD